MGATVTTARSLTAGALGGGVALFVLLVARVSGGPPGVLEVSSDALVRLMPPALFDWGIKTLGTGAKGILIAGICVGLVALGAGLAWALARLGIAGRRAWLDALILGGAALLIGELLVLPLAGAGILGRSLVSDPAFVHLPLLVAAAGYGSVAAAWIGLRAPVARSLTGPAGEPQSNGATPPLSRRSLLAAGVLVLGVAALVSSGALAVTRIVPRPRTALPGQVDPPGEPGFGYVRAVTPVPEFYFVSKDWVPMEIDPQSWTLNVDGLVDRPGSWTLDDIKALPAHEAFRTLQCISAESVTRSELIGNQRWQGARVSDVLDRVGVQPEARFIIWRCADGYHESLDLENARDPDSWLVYEMGPPGSPLPPEHGRPLRLLLAGRYGMAQPKYLTDMVLSATDEPGWWVRGGWQTDAPVRTYCRIDLPIADGISDSVLAGRPFTALGVASSGDRGISAVQYSLDRGATWRDAELEPLGGPIGRLTWVRWRAQVQLDEPGQVLFMARAADGDGVWQTDAVEEPFPRGASGYPRVPMRVYASLSDPG
jgi:DMSO/TMAO reductase YedYZ molybdopterin-dependent catalytic subunit